MDAGRSDCGGGWCEHRPREVPCDACRDRGIVHRAAPVSLLDCTRCFTEDWPAYMLTESGACPTCAGRR